MITNRSNGAASSLLSCSVENKNETGNSVASICTVIANELRTNFEKNLKIPLFEINFENSAFLVSLSGFCFEYLVVGVLYILKNDRLKSRNEA
jgi:hypothetical protein